MYFSLTAPTPGVDLSKIKSARVNVMDPQMNMILCQYATHPNPEVTGIALFLMLLDQTPFEFKRCHWWYGPNSMWLWITYPRIRLDDYSTIPDLISSKIAMNLASNITNVARIDLDITVNLLDEDFGFEIWWFMVSSNRVSWVLLFEEISETGDLTSDVVVNAMSEHISIAWFHQKIDSKSELIVVEAQPEVVCRRYTV